MNPQANTKIKTIVIAGASGYIGQNLIPLLLNAHPDAHIFALSRAKQNSTNNRVTWLACDLFSFESLERNLNFDIDLAFYLVHSMGPTAQLDQGSFADYDLILADNFARLIKLKNIRQLIYLGGLVPNEKTGLSLHLQSRVEVEDVFKYQKIPTTVLRAGLILGDGGSSYQILIKLVRRLPVMLCPSWTQTLTTPIDLKSTLSALLESSLNTDHINKTFDLSGCQPITYIEMMRNTASFYQLKRLFVKVPFFTPTLSRLWVSLITNTSKDLVYPLIESLEHEMVARIDHLHPAANPNRSYNELLSSVDKVKITPFSFFHFRARGNTVRSVQRLPLPKGKSADWIKKHYCIWLEKFLRPLIKVKFEQNKIKFCFLSARWVFLELTDHPTQDASEWQRLLITDGLLVGAKNQGRLEFRNVLENRFVLAAIHDYKPALPWYIYVLTQANLHLWVMKSFRQHLLRKK